ncbi:MAG: hypothetical protein II630_11580 [Bacteroidales bacterium]|nr:hypothetical protein [Bacteroidales bacterium]
MDVMTTARKRAMIETEDKYVFNEIYFGTEGLTSASAQHVSAMANVMVNDIKERINGLRLYEKSIRVIGEQETVTERVNNTLPEIADAVQTICKANALIAWLREAVREREAGIENIKQKDLFVWMAENDKEFQEQPPVPTLPKINFNNLKDILGTGLTVKEYNRFVELNSALAVYGEIIHENGLLTKHKKKLHSIAQNPTEVKESGRDTLITTYKVDKAAEDIDALYVRLQSEYRKLQAEKNGIEEKFNKLALEYQVNQMEEYKKTKSESEAKLKEWNLGRKSLEIEMGEWKNAQIQRIADLKIIIPNDLKGIYEELKAKYL